jgi:hypothetical protein
MSQKEHPSPTTTSARRLLARTLLLEALIYIPLAAGYIALLIHFASRPLTALYHTSAWLYALVSLLLVLGQGILTQVFTSWLLRKLGLRT